MESCTVCLLGWLGIMSLGSRRAVARARMTSLRRSHIALCGRATLRLSAHGHLGCCHLSAVNVGVQTPPWDLPVVHRVVYAGVELLGPAPIRVEGLEVLRTVSHVRGLPCALAPAGHRVPISPRPTTLVLSCRRHSPPSGCEVTQSPLRAVCDSDTARPTVHSASVPAVGGCDQG